MENAYTTPINDQEMDRCTASTLTLDSELSLPPMSPIWTNYVNPDTMTCCRNLNFDMELADMDPIKPIHSEKTGLILRLKIKRQPKVVLKLKQKKNKKAYKVSSSFVTPLNVKF